MALPISKQTLEFVVVGAVNPSTQTCSGYGLLPADIPAIVGLDHVCALLRRCADQALACCSTRHAGALSYPGAGVPFVAIPSSLKIPRTKPKMGFENAIRVVGQCLEW